MRSRLVLGAAAIAAVALVVTGCGSAAGAGPSGATGAAAAVVPADSVAFVAVDTDLGSSQWQALNGLLAKIPGSDALVTKLRQSLEQQSGLSWENDVKPALGPELDVAVLPAASGGKPEAVVLVQPSDRAKLDALLAKLGQSSGAQPLTKDVGGWTAISESQAALDAVAAATQHLADSSAYQEASGRLPGNSLATGYANGAEARQLVTSLGGSLPAGDGQLVWAAADVVASGSGLRVDGYVRRDGGTARQPYASQLVHEIPSGALAVADFQARPEKDAAASAAGPLAGALQSVAKTLGGETAVYVSPGAPFPAVTLVTRADDPQAVLDALHGALSSLGSAFGQGTTGSLDLGSLLGGLQLSHATVGGNLVVSTSQQALDAYAGSGEKLVDDATFQEATSTSGMPDQTTGFVYVNLKSALPAVQGLASLAGAQLPAADLGALRTLTAFGRGADGGVSSFSAFLEVK